MRTSKIKLLAFILLLAGSMSLLVSSCAKETEETTTPDAGVPIKPGTTIIDTSYTFDKSHCNVMWSSRFYDFSSTQLTGRFNMFNFKALPNDPTFKKTSFVFNEPDPSKMNLNFWVQLSTYNTSEPGRDGLGKCGLGYLGIVYLDSSKTKVDPLSDTARFVATKFVQTGANDYQVTGNFTFNRYRAPSGQPDGTPITKEVVGRLAFNGQKDFLNSDGVTGKLRAGFTFTFSFKRSDFMDNASTTNYFPVPTKADEANNIKAANNKTYGVWSNSTADQMDITVNGEFYKNH